MNHVPDSNDLRNILKAHQQRYFSSIMPAFIKQLMSKFLTLGAIKSANKLAEVDIAQHKDESLIAIGTVTKGKLNNLLNDGDMSQIEKISFFPKHYYRRSTGLCTWSSAFQHLYKRSVLRRFGV